MSGPAATYRRRPRSLVDRCHNHRLLLPSLWRRKPYLLSQLPADCGGRATHIAQLFATRKLVGLQDVMTSRRIGPVSDRSAVSALVLQCYSVHGEIMNQIIHRSRVGDKFSRDKYFNSSVLGRSKGLCATRTSIPPYIDEVSRGSIGIVSAYCVDDGRSTIPVTAASLAVY